MGQVVIEYGLANASSQQGPAPIFEANGAVSEEVTTSGTAASTTATAPFRNSVCVIMNNSSTAVWVAFGASPTAAVGTTHFVLPNSIREIGGISKGWKASVIDDS